MNKLIKGTLKTVLSEKKYKELQDKHRANVNRKIDIKKAIKTENEIQKTINEFHENFRDIMEEKGIYVREDKTVTPYNIELINKGGAEGVICNLAFPKGLSVDDLEKATKPLAQSVFGKSLIYIEDEPNKPTKFSAIKSWHNINYAPVVEFNKKKLTASQVFVGYNIRLEPIILDLAKSPHLLITGASGEGKSKLVEVIITNLAYSSLPEDLEFYFLQVTKDDQFKFELLEHCKGCITADSGNNKMETLEKSLAMLRHIEKILRERGHLVKKALGRKSEDLNIHIYNKKFPDKKLPVIQLWVDEASNLYELTSDKKLNKLIKEAQEIMSKIATSGRYIGVYLVNVLQRASKDELPRIIKINSGYWISFRQADAGASKVAIGDETSALGLPKRVFVFKGENAAPGFAKTPYSLWDKNVKILEEQGKIREDKQSVYDEAYSHWWNPKSGRSKESVDEDKKIKEKEGSKIVDTALKEAQKDTIKLIEQLSTATTEIEQKDDIIKRLMNENEKLNKMNTPNKKGYTVVVDGEEVNPPLDCKDDNDVNIEHLDSITEDTDKTNEVLTEIEDIKKDTADTQRESVKELIKDKNCDTSPYKQLDLSSFMKKKDK